MPFTVAAAGQVIAEGVEMRQIAASRSFSEADNRTACRAYRIFGVLLRVDWSPARARSCGASGMADSVGGHGGQWSRG